MSNASHAAASPPQAEPNSQPRRRALQSGFSLLARAEPQIWFTGGMLAVCLAMVVSLMALILASGLPTFWPQPLDWLVLSDGTLDAGEAKGTAVVATEDTGAENGGTSYYYRTENFDLTNTHYRWLKPTELLASGISRVPATALIERFEWGHLYGIPLRIVEPLVSGEEDKAQIASNAVADEFVKVYSTLLSNSASEVNLSEFVATAEQLSKNLNEKHLSDSVHRSIELAASQNLQYRMVGEQIWRPKSELDRKAILEGARAIVADPVAIKAQVESIIPVVRAQRKQIERLKHELSRLDVRISKLRIAIRQAELDTANVLPIQLDAAHYQLEQQTQLKQIAVGKTAILSLIKDAEVAGVYTKAFDDFEKRLLPAELAAIEKQLNEWRKPLENSPQPLRDAVANYESGYSEVVAQKQPIQKQITKLEAELDRGELIVCVPNNARRITDIVEADMRQTASGKIPKSVADQLSGMDIAVSENSEKVLYTSDALTLVEFTDSRATNHILSVSGTVNLLVEHPVAFKELVRVLPVNELTFGGKLSVYFSRWAEFLFEDPREANTLGGVFPAIWGTIVMTLIMTIAVVPFGVMAALYLREYTNGGALVSIIRISINNLAGVPSIVYGVFGFSFFCMTIGSFIDGGPKNADIAVWPSGTWYLILWLTVAVGTGAFLFSIFSSGPSHAQTALKRGLARAAFVLWLFCLVAAIALVAKSPFFSGFYAAQLPNPTFGKGGLLWASLTLALLTLPVVIVATEEALAAVPNSLREGSLACGASKWQTIRRIVLPHARPGILTGAILAMARGAGEVAPLMLVGALPNAPELPLDSEFPFFHGSRNFMHLGYQIYSLGFQSQNSEAAKPMVFTCTLLLILIVAALNLVAVFLRTRLRRRFQGNQF
jgi:phosphate transport system permease protein